MVLDVHQNHLSSSHQMGIKGSMSSHKNAQQACEDDSKRAQALHWGESHGYHDHSAVSHSIAALMNAIHNAFIKGRAIEVRVNGIVNSSHTLFQQCVFDVNTSFMTWTFAAFTNTLHKDHETNLLLCLLMETMECVMVTGYCIK